MIVQPGNLKAACQKPKASAIVRQLCGTLSPADLFHLEVGRLHLYENGPVEHFEKGSAKGEGNADSDGVSHVPSLWYDAVTPIFHESDVKDALFPIQTCPFVFDPSQASLRLFLKLLRSGLDNAGKTTIVKKFNGEDIDTISPTVLFRREIFCLPSCAFLETDMCVLFGTAGIQYQDHGLSRVSQVLSAPMREMVCISAPYFKSKHGF